MTEADAVARVAKELQKLLGNELSTDVGPDTSLVDDLALDSLKFIDLTLALEQSFGVPEFPMQEWVDGETEKENGFTVLALARACLDTKAAEARGGRVGATA